MLSKPPRKADRSQGVRVISRTAEIFRALKDDGRGMSLGEIAERIGLPRSTVQRLVNALIAEGFVAASPAGGGLRLGPEFRSLAAAGRMDVAELVRPVVTALSRRTGETVDLAVFRDDHMVFVDQVVGPHRLRAVSAVGEVFPMTVTANGKATLSLVDDAKIRAVAERELAGTRGRETAIRRLFDEIGRVRETGYALDLNEHTDGISAVGAAFSAPDGVIHAISIPVPSQRFAEKRKALVAALLEAVADVREIV